ncbi:single-stranded DNA-binding protein [Sinomicrobium weinanense]|uniref:Single-stranded DNA-binding protein n=1 Tax=Sinomicrobium weinanense TaxID=2842200 RepID=A0A926Q286_9FLAO|nr:single-stranded DNA-binding protein [Sinomicrobium weinanense]MBC9794651.1 single-stranded DNA-binding protein [Sinomicrobium weinanense]MBU3124136.1 single-stranded DNA-binding protein [Sinomicrobium weinanense]
MSGTLNKVMLIGHLGDDVKMHYFEGGNSLGRFPLATNETYVNRQTGERVTNTEWHNIVVRNKAAEICEKYLSKGDKIYVEGRIKTRQWQGEDGNTRYSTEIQVTDFTFLSEKRENSDSNYSQAAPSPSPESGAPKNDPAPPQDTGEDDDLPF